MATQTVLLLIILLLLLGSLPRWSYSASWGYAPSSTLSVVLLVVLMLALLGRI